MFSELLGCRNANLQDTYVTLKDTVSYPCSLKELPIVGGM